MKTLNIDIRLNIKPIKNPPKAIYITGMENIFDAPNIFIPEKLLFIHAQ